MVEMKSLWHLGVVQIACGDNHCLVLTVRGLVLSFGRGKYGQLGLGDFENKGFPQVVRLPLPVVQAGPLPLPWPHQIAHLHLLLPSIYPETQREHCFLAEQICMGSSPIRRDNGHPVVGPRM
jgi:hypothetical protein